MLWAIFPSPSRALSPRNLELRRALISHRLNLPASYVSQVAPQFPVLNVGDVVGFGNGSDSFTQFQTAQRLRYSWQRHLGSAADTA